MRLPLLQLLWQRELCARGPAARGRAPCGCCAAQLECTDPHWPPALMVLQVLPIFEKIGTVFLFARHEFAVKASPPLALRCVHVLVQLPASCAVAEAGKLFQPARLVLIRPPHASAACCLPACLQVETIVVVAATCSTLDQVVSAGKQVGPQTTRCRRAALPCLTPEPLPPRMPPSPPLRLFAPRRAHPACCRPARPPAAGQHHHQEEQPRPQRAPPAQHAQLHRRHL